ncbi:hypothetical protein CW731_08805 [Polaribacter sp. ALD11]|uniref:HYC_CC_PP family protein n=1 Tax=Polaribacter sp. ALD11 TaxID=2058137 RepID=UPI000C31384B|nr:hypothetical protein [Polaribacter sp. ALD11]AUC85379.1 hypothetical protein CW731_08805 [Polaribacter sp. ALD11]
MKISITKITSFLLAFLVLFSTFSFTVESHYCGDSLIAVSFTGEADVCKSDITNDSSIKTKDCCSDEVHKIEGQKELQQYSKNKISFQKQQFLATNIISYQTLFVGNKATKVNYNSLFLPDKPLDYQVLYQSFLI